MRNKPHYSMQMFCIAMPFLELVYFHFLWSNERHKYLDEHPGTIRAVQQTDKATVAPCLLWLTEPGQIRLGVLSPNFWQQRQFQLKNPGPEAATIRALFPEATIEVIEGAKPGQIVQIEGILWYTWYPGHDWDWKKPKNVHQVVLPDGTYQMVRRELRPDPD